MPATIQIQRPDGKLDERIGPGDPGMSLATWLEQEQFPLNTRCAGRGLCRGCMVQVDGKSQRACQISCEGVHHVEIPETSLRDNRLNGVSAFEVQEHKYPRRQKRGLGLAVDIGTTTVAAALWDLATGECLGTSSRANEQRRFGDNVLSRIDSALESDHGGRELQKALVQDTVEPLVVELLGQASASTSQLTETIMAGNTVMLHSLTQDSLTGFSAYPFRPVYLDEQRIESTDIGLSQSFSIRLAPSLGPFVGADITVGALAAGLLKGEEVALLVDFGTNGEILLKAQDTFLATATAAGPAFEGGWLSCGRTAGPGVVSSIERKEDRWTWKIIGENQKLRASGISGAAYIDFIRAACESGMLGAMGRLESGHPGVSHRDNDGEQECCIYLTKQLYMTEADVAELIQAKAAIAAGIMTLLEEASLKVEDLDKLYIAGGFGYHLSPVKAMAVGMIPTLPQERIRVIGNSSLGGCSLMLQHDCEDSIHFLRERCRVVELNHIDSFEDNFIDCMPLEPIDPGY